MQHDLDTLADLYEELHQLSEHHYRQQPEPWLVVAGPALTPEAGWRRPTATLRTSMLAAPRGADGEVIGEGW